MKILVVDDNTSITSSLEKYLKIKGYDVEVCNQGKKGLDLIKNNEWKIVLLDLSMPEFSGIDIIESLENEDILKEKKIILFTASSIPDIMIEKLKKKEGIINCLKKPLPLKEIVQVLTS